MKLDVLISTLGIGGINKVADMHLPVTEGVNYIVSWQLSPSEVNTPLSSRLMRDDISVYRLEGKGLSLNRNNAIDKSTAEICLIADDDLHYTSEQLQSVIAVFGRDANLGLATFRHTGSGKWYPGHEFDLNTMPRGYYVSSVDIAFRREKIGRLRFNPYMGLGASELHACEEALFVYQALHMGIKCRFFPIDICHHNGTTTGLRRVGKGVVMANGAYLSIAYPCSALLRLPLWAWRNWRHGRIKLFPAMASLLKGYIYGKRYFNHDGTMKRVPRH